MLSNNTLKNKETKYPDFKYENKSKILWDHIILNYPDAVLDYEYKHGELIFYTNKVAAKELNENYLYSCCKDESGNIHICNDF